MKKAKGKLGKSYVPCVVLICVAAVVFILRLTVGIMGRNNISLWILGLSSEEISPALAAVSGICISLFCGFYLSSVKSKHKAVIALISAVLSVLVMAEVGFEYSRQPEYEYFQVLSDDGEHEIIIKEGSFLLLGTGSFYEKISPITMVKLGDYSTDDGYRPFTDNNYEIEWYEDAFEVNYSFNGDGITKKETVQYVK